MSNNMDVELYAFERSEIPLYLQRLLEKNKINTIGDLIEKSELDLLKLRHFGRKSLRHVKTTLKDIGLSLKEEV